MRGLVVDQVGDGRARAGNIHDESCPAVAAIVMRDRSCRSPFEPDECAIDCALEPSIPVPDDADAEAAVEWQPRRRQAEGRRYRQQRVGDWGLLGRRAGCDQQGKGEDSGAHEEPEVGERRERWRDVSPATMAVASTSIWGCTSSP